MINMRRKGQTFKDFFDDNNYKPVYDFKNPARRPDFRSKVNRINYFNDTLDVVLFLEQ